MLVLDDSMLLDGLDDDGWLAEATSERRAACAHARRDGRPAVYPRELLVAPRPTRCLRQLTTERVTSGSRGNSRWPGGANGRSLVRHEVVLQATNLRTAPEDV